MNDEYKLEEEKELTQQLKQEKKLKEKNKSERAEHVVQQLKGQKIEIPGNRNKGNGNGAGLA